MLFLLFMTKRQCLPLAQQPKHTTTANTPQFQLATGLPT
jgi:hypothetical protein